MMRVADLSEFSLIARLTAGLPTAAGVRLGVGDDAAVLDFGGEWLVATCDAQVQDLHFRLESATPEAIGHKALAVNLSDIAAMGARPRCALVSLLLPPDLPLATLDGLYAGLRALASVHDVAIVGGNIAANPGRLVIDITVLGTAIAQRLLHRSGAQPGDALLVTGTLGAAAAGWHLQDRPTVEVVPDVRVELLTAQQMPTPRVAAGQWLAAHGATAALDCSDGLLADLKHLCVASGVAAEVDAAALPITAATHAAAAALGADPHAWALSGGEDYELIWTIPAALANVTAAQLLAETGTSATRIGICRAGAPDITVHGSLGAFPPHQGWDHFHTHS